VQLVLASASPRRLELLQQLGYDPLKSPVDIDESVHDSEKPYAYVARMAKEKLVAAAHQFCLSNSCIDGRDYLMLAGDTVCVHGEQILIKPEDFSDFQRMMRVMSGDHHTVATAYALGVLSNGQLSEVQEHIVKTKVFFRGLSDQEIADYWKTEEPFDKAGGYGIQGIGAVLVDKIEGSYSNVVGLPLTEVHQSLKSFGLESKL